MKLFRNYVQAAIFIGCALLAVDEGMAQSDNNGKLEILLPVTALDEKKGVSFEPTKEKIKVFLGKSEQTITSIVSAETPSKIVFLVDYSGSMREAFSDPTKVKAAFMQFFQSSNSANEYALIAFNQDAALIKDWTTKPQNIIDGFDSLTSQKPQGVTALYNGLAKGMNYLNARATGKRALILITDGKDKNSQVNRQEIVAKSNELQIPLYFAVLDNLDDRAAGVFGGRSARTDGTNWVGKDTGGEVFFVNKPADFEKALMKIGDLIRQQFIIKFIPNIGNDDKRVNITIKFFSSTNPSKEIDNLKILYPQYYVAKK